MIAPDLLNRIRAVRVAVFDVDGIMTDNGLYRADDGSELKRFSSRDGLGLRLLRDNGVITAIITGRESRLVAHRALELGVDHLYQGRRNKRPALDELCQALSVTYNEVAYMGDDLIDLPVLTRVGLALTVRDADPEVLNRAHWVARRPAGNGAVREACELILRGQDKWEGILADFLA
ncbi:HAD hydrolase family protein [Granulosicoccaceae sp. 1_MG-2023]|nr:HAD hydrolase family protein [Granulosicoccaceae sp. 1_MG-2023]